MKWALREDEILRVRDLDVRFYTYAGEVHAVSRVSFNVRANETVALVGETGCGKTVTTRALTRLIEAPGKIVGGSALFRRRDGSVVDLLRLSDDEIRRIRGDEIAYIFQDPSSALDPLYTVGYHVWETVADHRSAKKREVLREAVRLLRETAVASPEKRVKSYPHELSGGMRQRVVIALGIANGPRMLIADEPTTNLDVTVQAQILELLRDIQKKHSTSILLITHNMGVVAEMASRVYVMYAGKIVEEGGVEEIFYDPLHPYTTLLLRAVPNPLSPSARLQQIPGFVPSLIDPPPGCRFHPRCPKAVEICRLKEPPEVELGGGRRVSCWLYAGE
ncbi:MAG: ABC transporter ATP-binding protein [Fervidicoccaceae archaeon]